VRDWTTQGVTVLSLWFTGGPLRAGLPGNEAEPVYVGIADGKSVTAMVYHDDPNATRATAWTEWSMELKEFGDQGVDLTDVDMLIVGFGNRSHPSAGGTGTVYLDDVRLYRPQAVLE
jgi:hypothetical protein